MAKFVGAPPGYIGYEEGGLLTEAIRKNPHAVLLLDEIEKAHADIFNTLLQVMDYATLTDNTGKKADFRNVILLMTSNAGAREIGRQTIGFEGLPINRDAVFKALEKTFSPEFRNRLDGVVNFQGLTDPVILQIVKKAVAEFAAQLAEKKVRLTLTEECCRMARPEGLLPRIRGAGDRPADPGQDQAVLRGRGPLREPPGGGRCRSRTSKTTTWSSGSPMPVYRLPDEILFPPGRSRREERPPGRRGRPLAGAAPGRLPGGDLPLVRRRGTDPLVVARSALRPSPGRTSRLAEHAAVPEEGARPDHLRSRLPGGDRRLSEAPPRPGRHLDHRGDAGGLLRPPRSRLTPTPSRPGRTGRSPAASTASRSAAPSSANRCSRRCRTPPRRPSSPSSDASGS